PSRVEPAYAERLQEPGSAVDRGAPADAHDDLSRARREGRGDQLTRAERRCAQGIASDSRQRPPPRRRSDVDDRGSVREHDERGLARPPQRIVDGSGTLAAAERDPQDLAGLVYEDVAHGGDIVAGQEPAATQEAASLPVRQPELRATPGPLPVDPAR